MRPLIKKSREVYTPNVIPLLDVLLVLVAVLLVLTPVAKNLEIELPKLDSKTPPMALSQHKIDIEFISDKIYINGRLSTDLETSLKVYDRKSPVVLIASSSENYGKVIGILSSIKALGFTQIAIQGK